MADPKEERMHAGRNRPQMGLPDALQTVRDAVSARQVFGDPVERDGVTVIPAASVLGGGGGGSEGRSNPTAEREPGAGLGFGIWGRPVGAIEITDHGARWTRAPLDLTGVLMVALMFAVPAAFAAWARLRRKH